MNFSTIEVPGEDAIRVLNERRTSYPSTGEYPFLIGDQKELERIEECAEFNEQDPAEIIQLSFELNPAAWMAGRRKEAEEYEFAPEELLGAWPGEVVKKGSITLHTDILTHRVKSKVYVGLAKIDAPWQLPAILKFGAWNDCPYPDMHCALHRRWQERFGAEITGMSGDVVECVVQGPPTNREEAIELAWEQYWYCTDIVDQGCGTVSKLAATLLNSRYWYFWWD